MFINLIFNKLIYLCVCDIICNFEGGNNEVETTLI